MLQPTGASSKGASPQSKVDNLESHFFKGPNSVAASKQSAVITAAGRSMMPMVTICVVPHGPQENTPFECDFFQECCCRSVSENKANS